MPETLRQAVLIANKDFRVFLTDRFAMAFALAFPLMFVLGFTLALSGVGPEDDQLILTVATREGEGISHDVLESLTSSPESSVESMPYDDALTAVEDGQLDGFVAFPADFTESITSGRPTDLEVVSHSDEPFAEAALLGLARSISGQVTAAQVALQAVIRLRLAEGASLSELDPSALTNLEPLISFEIDQIGELKPFKASNFTLPGYLTMFVFFAATMSAAAIARERANQTLERLMSNGVGRYAVVLGKYLSIVYVALIQLAVLWTVGLLGFRIDLGDAPLAVIAISVIMALTSAGFAVMMASVIRAERTADSAGVLVSLMLAPIGGCWWPLFIAPEWLQGLARLTPHGWANTGFNKIMLFGAEFGDVTLEIGALAAMGVAFILVALWRFRLTV